MLLVLHQGAIGDFLLTMSVIQPAAEMWKVERVVAIASASSASLAAGRSVIDRCVHPDAVGFHSLFAPRGPLNVTLQSLLDQARWVLSFLGGSETPVHRRLIAYTGGQVIGIDPRPTPATLAGRTHITDQWAADFARAGGPVVGPQPGTLQFDPPTADASGRTERREAALVVLHPGSGGRAKCWPTDRFVALADRLAPVRIGWMLGPTELESEGEPARSVRARVRATGEPLIAEPDLEDAVRALLALRPAGYVGNDGGMTHVAAALGVPTVAIFGPTVSTVWRPLGAHVAVCVADRPTSDICEVRLEQVWRVVRRHCIRERRAV